MNVYFMSVVLLGWIFHFSFPSVKLEFYNILTDVMKRMGHSRAAES